MQTVIEQEIPNEQMNLVQRALMNYYNTLDEDNYMEERLELAVLSNLLNHTVKVTLTKEQFFDFGKESGLYFPEYSIPKEIKIEPKDEVQGFSGELRYSIPSLEVNVLEVWESNKLTYLNFIFGNLTCFNDELANIIKADATDLSRSYYNLKQSNPSKSHLELVERLIKLESEYHNTF